MNNIKIWVEFENIKTINQISNKADIKLIIEGDTKKVDIVSQLDLKYGYELEFEEIGEHCLTLENEHFNYKENFIIEEDTTDIEIVIN